MNIFVVDSDPIKSADYLWNNDSFHGHRRPTKMILESCQLLCNAINLCKGTSPYKTTHKNHPVSIWTRQSRKNFKWLYVYCARLSFHYYIKNNKNHLSFLKCKELIKQIEILPDKEITDFFNCTTHHKHIENVFDAYKMELEYKWSIDLK